MLARYLQIMLMMSDVSFWPPRVPTHMWYTYKHTFLNKRNGFETAVAARFTSILLLLFVHLLACLGQSYYVDAELHRAFNLFVEIKMYSPGWPQICKPPAVSTSSASHWCVPLSSFLFTEQKKKKRKKKP